MIVNQCISLSITDNKTILLDCEDNIFSSVSLKFLAINLVINNDEY